jgi:hypothetical protein
MNDRDHMYFGQDESSDQIGVIDNFRAVFGRSYAAEPDVLVEHAMSDANHLVRLQRMSRSIFPGRRGC